ALVRHIRNRVHSHFRSRLWKLRDDLVDDLIYARLERTDAALRLVRLVETYIRIGRRHSFIDVLVAGALFRKSSMPPVSQEILDERVSDADRERLIKYLHQFQAASVGHLLRSSPSGWVFLLLMTLRKRFRRQSDLRKVDDTSRFQDQAEQIELEVMPK